MISIAKSLRYWKRLIPSYVYLDRNRGKVRYRGNVVRHANTPRSYIVQNSICAVKCETYLNFNELNDNSIEIYTDDNNVSTCSHNTWLTSPRPSRKAKEIAKQRLPHLIDR